MFYLFKFEIIFSFLYARFVRYVDVRFCFDQHHSLNIQLNAYKTTAKVIMSVNHKAHRIKN